MDRHLWRLTLAPYQNLSYQTDKPYTITVFSEHRVGEKNVRDEFLACEHKGFKEYLLIKIEYAGKVVLDFTEKKKEEDNGQLAD